MLLDLFSPDINWSTVFVGLGAFLAGAGSVLSGIAALRVARREDGDAEVDDLSND